MIGPSGSGKTSILYQLYFSKPVVDINTYGFNLETITIDRMELTLWDIGGSLHNHTLRQHYAPGAVGIICVIDSSDETQFEDAKARLWGLYSLYGSLRRETVLLVFANKQDCLNSMSVKEMKDRLELETMAQGLRWHVQGCVATTGDGLTAGMTWMVTQLKGSR
ncbi:ADP-ribosylation factor, Arf Arf6 [Linnemannia zychae]|nr:ADP-ribosylation factor, Arf Arf6 [Linnemannia zychae]